MRNAVLAEFASPERLVDAIESMRASGYAELDAFAPYTTREIHDALSHRPSPIPRIACVLGLSGAGAAYFLQWLLEARLYPIHVGARPEHFPLAFLVISFEMGILLAAFTAFFLVLALSRLPRLWSPEDEVPGIGRACDDRYWLAVTGPDAVRRTQAICEALHELEPLRIAVLRKGKLA